MKIVAIVQARMGSSRLPGKVMMKILGKEILLHMVDRLTNSRKINEVVVATTTDKKDDVIERLINSYTPEAAQPGHKHGRGIALSVFRGSEDDVLDRYYQAARKSKADIIIRVTSDCPLIDWEVIDLLVSDFEKGKYDYVSNVLTRRTYPRGLDAEVFSFHVLELIWKRCREEREREHVTTYVRENPGQFRTKNVESETDLSGMRWTVDEKDDFVLVEKIYSALYPKNRAFRTPDILSFLDANPSLSMINMHVEQKKNIRSSAN